MKIALSALRGRAVQQLVIESVDLSLYIAQAQIDGDSYLVTDSDGKPLKTRNLLSMRRHFADVTVAACVLRQRSAYDEMIGHGSRTDDNVLEIPLSPGLQPLPAWEH